MNWITQNYILQQNGCYSLIWISEGSKRFTHYLSDTNRFDDSNKGPSSGISVCVCVAGGGGGGESTRVFIQVNILK